MSNLPADVGQRIKARRMQLHYTIAEVAKRSRLSSPFLSQLEHGKTQASLDSLVRIAKALEVNLSFFTVNPDGADSQHAIRTPDLYRHFSVATSKVTYAQLGLSDSERQLEPLLLTLTPNSTETLSHVGEAFLMVLQGVLKLHLADQEFLLETNHTAHLKPGVSYSCCNPTTQEVRLLWVGTPRLF